MPVSSASAGTICPGDEHTGDDRTSHDRTSHDRTQAGLKPLPTAFDSPTPRNDLQPLTRENMNAAWVHRVSAGFREHEGFEPLSDAVRAASLQAVLTQLGGGDVWLFGYGSVMWNPIVRFEERRQGHVHGYHRRYGLWVHWTRGSRERPGLMLGLEPGGSCRGIVFRIPRNRVKFEFGLIWMREMISGAYVPKWVTVRTPMGHVRAIAFVVNSGHPLYAGKLSLQTEASHIARAAGEFGSCRAYLENTIDQLNAIGLSDGYLLRLQRQLAHMDHDAQFRRGAVEAPR